MTVVTVSPGATTVSGDAVTVKSDLGLDPADPIAVYGMPVDVVTVENSTYVTAEAVRARVLDSSGAFVKHLPYLDGLRWSDEFNTAGAGSIDMLRYFKDADTTASGVLASGYQIVISVGSRDVFRIVLDSEPGYRIDAATGDRIDAWAGAGALGILNAGMVEPEYGWRAEATDDRSFDYGSDPSKGGWLVAAEWQTPVGKPVRDSWRWTYKKRRLPKKWPEKKAQWLWWRNPDATNVADETCYFRSSFTDVAGRYGFWVCGDDTLEFQVDGEIRATTGPGGWKNATKVVLNLSAGTHYVAAKVTNTPGTAGNSNRSGFLCAIGRINGDGDVVEWVRRSNPSTWTVRRQRSAPPGWFAAQILKQLVSEQVSRGCAGHSGITYGFTTTTDSSGRAWITRQDASIPVGTKGLDWVQQLVETGMDVYMSPDLKLYAWRSRGADRSATVRIDQGADAAPTDASGSQEASIQNVAYARARSGFVGATHAASVAAKGRREALVTLGGSRSASQTARALGAMLPDLAAPAQTRQVSISGASSGPQPYKHFNNGDWISYRAPGATTWTRHRVVSIAGEVNPAGHPDWTVSLIED